jgi:nucleotide-binding universal stress UspA family protein
MITSALLALKPSVAQKYVIDYAMAITRQLDAELVACTVIDVSRIAPPESVPIGGGAYKKERDDKLIADAHDAAQRLSKACEMTAKANGLSCRAMVVEGDVVAKIAQEVQEHDLLILGHSTGNPTGDESLLFQILKRSPRPAIVFPKNKVTGDSVLIAYDGSFQAARALASFAQSGLGKDHSIHVVSCQSNLEEAKRLCELAGRFLIRHGIRPELHPEDGSPVDVINSLAERHSAELLVMGAFGRATVLEFFLGTTTRKLLHELPLPVYLDH